MTASTALVGVAHNSGICLGIYSFLMVVLLIGQAVLAIALFADNSWQKYLPHDDTGEAERVSFCRSVHQAESLRNNLLLIVVCADCKADQGAAQYCTLGGAGWLAVAGEQCLLLFCRAVNALHASLYSTAGIFVSLYCKQVFGVMLAYMLSSAQQQLLEDARSVLGRMAKHAG